MESLSSKNKIVKYLCVIDVFTKDAWVKTLKEKKVKQDFIETVNKSTLNQINYGLIKEHNFIMQS